MTDAQLYLAISIPTFALLLGMIGNGLLFNALSARITGLEGRITGLESRLEDRMSGLEARMLALETSMTARFDLIMGRL